jgi:putative ABC transport system permease protein
MPAVEAGMLSARWYKVLHDLLGSKTRTVLIVLSMAVGLFAVGIILSGRTILSEGLAVSFAAIHPSSGTIHTEQLFEDEFVNAVRGMRNVSEADARRSLSARIQVNGGEWDNITLFVVDDYDDIRVNKIASQSGPWPPPARQLLIERAALPVIHAQVGDVVGIKMPDDTQREMLIAGLAYDPAQMPAQLDGTPYGYITFETLRWLGQPYGFNELHVISSQPQDKAWSQQVVNEVKTRAERAGYIIPLSMNADPGQVPMDSVLQAILLLMGLLGILSLFLSIFLVINTVTALLAQQKRQIGVMKAVGGGTVQILGMYLVMVMLYGVFALMLAIPLGVVGARALSRALAVFFNFDLPSMAIPPQAIIIQLAIGLLLPVTASIIPFVSGLRISPAEAMSSYTMGRGRFGRGPIDRLISGANLWFTRPLPVRSGLLSLRNMFRSKGRLLLTLTTLTLGSATFISVFNVRASLTSTVDDMIRWFRGDIMVTLDRPYLADRIEQDALTVPGIRSTDVLLMLPARRVRPDSTEGEMLYMFAPRVSDDSLIAAPGIISGRWLLPNDHNAVVVPTAFFQDEPDLKLGDELVLKIYGRERPFKIVGTYIGSSFAAMIFGNYDYVSRITDRIGEADIMMATTHSPDVPAVAAASGRLETQFERSGIRVDTVHTMQTERAEAEVIFDVIVSLLLVMAVLLALVGGLGLMGTMSINVLERTREIGVLRAIGAPNRAVAQVFMVEGIAIGVLSWLLGAALAIPMSQALNDAVGSAIMGVPLTYSYSLPGLWLWLAVVVILSALASLIPARNASRLTVREVLAYE